MALRALSPSPSSSCVINEPVRAIIASIVLRVAARILAALVCFVGSCCGRWSSSAGSSSSAGYNKWPAPDAMLMMMHSDRFGQFIFHFHFAFDSSKKVCSYAHFLRRPAVARVQQRFVCNAAAAAAEAAAIFDKFATAEIFGLCRCARFGPERRIILRQTKHFDDSSSLQAR